MAKFSGPLLGVVAPGVFVEGDVEHPVQTVFDGPLSAGRGGEGLGGQEAGRDITGPMRQHPRSLKLGQPESRPCRDRTLFRQGSKGSRLHTMRSRWRNPMAVLKPAIISSPGASTGRAASVVIPTNALQGRHDHRDDRNQRRKRRRRQNRAALRHLISPLDRPIWATWESERFSAQFAPHATARRTWSGDRNSRASTRIPDRPCGRRHPAQPDRPGGWRD
jgi:hypothetical protein